jgi:hypothetical protein
MAFPFRMNAGFAGDVNRSHPVSIEPGKNDTTNPVQFFGQAVIGVTANNSYRGVLSSDTGVTTIDGIAARPFPIQQVSAVNFGAIAFGAAVLPPAGEIDVVKKGYILVPIFGQPTKFGAVNLWIAASTGGGVFGTDHVQGGFEASATGGSTVALTNCRFNGPPDPNGIGEISIDTNY